MIDNSDSAARGFGFWLTTVTTYYKAKARTKRETIQQ